jgi:hypothetical protein
MMPLAVERGMRLECLEANLITHLKWEMPNNNASKFGSQIIAISLIDLSGIVETY